MASTGRELLKLLVERDPVTEEFRSGVRAILRPECVGVSEADLWHDVFVQQPLPWSRFMQSALLHATALALIWTVSISWMRQQKILDHAAFDRSSLITYTPQEYLPPLDTGASEAPKTLKGDPAFAKQPILSVPQEANSRAQTIVVPPDLKLNKDLPLPNIIAAGTIVPAVPLEATHANLSRVVAPQTQVIAPSPDVQFAQSRVVPAAIRSDIIAPAPEITQRHTRGLAAPETAVVEPPPDLMQSTIGKAGRMNIGPSTVVAPAPQFTLAEQHAMASRGTGRLSGGSIQPVGPAPSVSASGGANSSGRLIALGIRPVAPSGPVAVPAGNRRGTFAATPQGKLGASGIPEVTGLKSDATGLGSGIGARNNGSLPSGLHVARGGSAADDGREIASLSTPRTGAEAHSGARTATAVSDDKITDVDRQVFGGKRPYAMTLNMPNLNSSTGSWEIRFAEVEVGKKVGDLLAPVAMEKSDPGYPLELIRSNVHGMVTLFAVIGADGKVAGIRVLNSPDDRLDSYATKALAKCKFAPAERAGKPVALEAVVRIPFRMRRSF
jgi:TonB family protein